MRRCAGCEAVGRGEERGFEVVSSSRVDGPNGCKNKACAHCSLLTPASTHGGARARAKAGGADGSDCTLLGRVVRGRELCGTHPLQLSLVRWQVVLLQWQAAPTSTGTVGDTALLLTLSTSSTTGSSTSTSHLCRCSVASVGTVLGGVGVRQCSQDHQAQRGLEQCRDVWAWLTVPLQGEVVILHVSTELYC